MFSQNLTLQEAIGTVAQINEGLRRPEFVDAFCKKIQLLIDSFSSFLTKCRNRETK